MNIRMLLRDIIDGAPELMNGMGLRDFPTLSEELKFLFDPAHYEFEIFHSLVITHLSLLPLICDSINTLLEILDLVLS